jgi:hypothetical protein
VRRIRRLQVPQQANTRTNRAIGELLQRLGILIDPMTSINAIVQMVLRFQQRGLRDPHESREIWMSVKTEPFCEICRR